MIEDKETARAMLDDGLVAADLMVELESTDDDYEVMLVNKKASKLNGVIKRNIKKGKPISKQKKPDKKLLLALAAQGCRKMTSWVNRSDPVNPVTM